MIQYIYRHSIEKRRKIKKSHSPTRTSSSSFIILSSGTQCYFYMMKEERTNYAFQTSIFTQIVTFLKVRYSMFCKTQLVRKKHKQKRRIKCDDCVFCGCMYMSSKNTHSVVAKVHVLYVLQEQTNKLTKFEID